MKKARAVFPICCITALLVAAHTAAEDASAVDSPQPAPSPAAPAPEMKGPRIITAEVDWDGARVEAADGWAPLNAATGKLLANVAASGVPVLLPIDTAAFLRDQAQGNAADTDKYFADFHTPTFFFTGPSGYDAAFRIPLNDASVHPAEVQISASSLIYELDGPAANQGEPVPGLEHDFPGIRRVLLESRLRYIFSRFGVPYFASIAVLRRTPRPPHYLPRRGSGRCCVSSRRSTSSAAHRIAGRRRPRQQTIERPERTSADFTYNPGGDILARHRHARARRTAATPRSIRNSFPDGACAGLHQLAIVHELGQLRSDRPLRARRSRQRRGLSLPRERRAALSTTRPKTTPIHGGITSASTATTR